MPLSKEIFRDPQMTVRQSQRTLNEKENARISEGNKKLPWHILGTERPTRMMMMMMTSYGPGHIFMVS
jgi:hypothetical protein